MYAQELVIADKHTCVYLPGLLLIADQLVESVACWHGKDTLGFTYECYFGELAGDGSIATAVCYKDAQGHAQYAAEVLPLCQRPAQAAQELYEELSACYHARYNAERYERTEIDGKAYQVTTIIPKDASPDFKAMVTEKMNIKVAFSGIMNYIQSRIELKRDTLLNIKAVDVPGVISLLAQFPHGNMQAYATKDPLSGALIVASAPEGLAGMAEAIIFHERTETVYHGAEEANAGLMFRSVKYPVQRVENAQEVYTALEKLYKEHFEKVDHFNAPIVPA
jgi:hypothetical protein